MSIMDQKSKRYDLHASFGYQATLAARVYESRLEEALKELELTRLSWCVLIAIGEEQLSHPSDIAEFVGIDRTSLSRTLRQMEDHGFLERRTATKDRRRTSVGLTDLGARKLDLAIPIAQETASHFASKFGGEQMAALTRLLKKMRMGETGPLKDF